MPQQTLTTTFDPSFGGFNPSTGTFILPSLPFEVTALNPVTSVETLEVHLGKHHKAYVDKANEKLEKLTKRFKSGVEVVAFARDTGDDALFEQAAQALNHAFFWTCQQAAGHTRPTGTLEAAINEAYTDFEGFIKAAVDLAKSRVGSGWLWLYAGQDSKLALSLTHDADTLLDDESRNVLLVCDIWEHAYYLDHKSNKPEWVENYFSQIVDWSVAKDRFEQRE
jgi:superoxide dismutase, Fe-Mn family